MGDIVAYCNPELAGTDPLDNVWANRHVNEIPYLVVGVAVDEGYTSVRCIALEDEASRRWASDEMFVPPERLKVLNHAHYDPPLEDE